MSEFTKFTVCKKAKKNKITACEFENLKGLSVSPKKDFKLDGMINVSKVTLYNPVLIKNYVYFLYKNVLLKIFFFVFYDVLLILS